MKNDIKNINYSQQPFLNKAFCKKCHAPKPNKGLISQIFQKSFPAAVVA